MPTCEDVNPEFDVRRRVREVALEHVDHLHEGTLPPASGQGQVGQAAWFSSYPYIARIPCTEQVNSSRDVTV